MSTKQFHPRKSAFTLVELMISIAMVVILMIGVHQVFKMSSDTISMGNQIGVMSQNNRSIQQIFHDDFNRRVADAPLFILRSGVSSNVVPIPPNAPVAFGGFNTEAERLADKDGDPLTQDFNNNGQEGENSVFGEITPVSIYNNRNHRVDIVGFPVRGLFRRATANDGSYTSPLTSQDAFIFYEHLALPPIVPGSGPPGRYFGPGEGTYQTNLQNFYASQWILGRVALLMRDAGTIFTNDNYIARTVPGLNGVPDLTPLRWNSFDNQNIKSLTQSRYDLLGASLELLRQDVTDIRNNLPAGQAADGINSIWWQPLVYRVNNTAPNPIPVITPLARFEANPRIPKPMTSEAMARAMPILLNNCSQFIVEYAGDFVTQNNAQFLPGGGDNYAWGEVTSNVPDGVVDYVVDHTNVTQNDYNVAARIRWYGLPRDTNGDRKIVGFSPNYPGPRPMLQPGIKYANAMSGNELIDVVPLDDVLHTSGGGYIPSAFERELPNVAPGGDYGAITTTPDKNAFRYTCVFANSAPAMLRIVIKLEDPAGRLPEGQWYEYVVTAP